MGQSRQATGTEPSAHVATGIQQRSSAPYLPTRPPTATMKVGDSCSSCYSGLLINLQMLPRLQHLVENKILKITSTSVVQQRSN